MSLLPTHSSTRVDCRVCRARLASEHARHHIQGIKYISASFNETHGRSEYQELVNDVKLDKKDKDASPFDPSTEHSKIRHPICRWLAPDDRPDTALAGGSHACQSAEGPIRLVSGRPSHANEENNRYLR